MVQAYLDIRPAAPASTGESDADKLLAELQVFPGAMPKPDLGQQ